MKLTGYNSIEYAPSAFITCSSHTYFPICIVRPGLYMQQISNTGFSVQHGAGRSRRAGHAVLGVMVSPINFSLTASCRVGYVHLPVVNITSLTPGHSYVGRRPTTVGLPRSRKPWTSAQPRVSITNLRYSLVSLVNARYLIIIRRRHSKDI